MKKEDQFPQGFRWGTATSSYQIEGAAAEDGKGESIWDQYCRQPGKIIHGDRGDIADDHYHRWKSDVALLKELNIEAYRFSISWPRIFPDGKGKVNPKGLDFYNRLVDELLNAGIHPMVTLYHWDLPTALDGGWLNRETVHAFVEFSKTVVEKLGDRVKEWVTINEPYCASYLGYYYGVQAPGHTSLAEALTAAHHLLLAHGLAVPVIREECRGARVGIVLNQSPVHAASKSVTDQDAARRVDGEINRWFLDPLYGRNYPLDMLHDYREEKAVDSLEPKFIIPGDMERIAVPTDFLGINYYSRQIVTAKKPLFKNHKITQKPGYTDIGWEIYPHGLFETLCRTYFTYHPQELIVTENGASYSDGPDKNGQVHDARRVDYLHDHLAAVFQTIRAGVPVSGYYAWSFLDNFEWSYGYSQRFGLVHVDYDTQKRTPKDSAFWYSKVIRQNGLD